jgi:hypothetical protein
MKDYRVRYHIIEDVMVKATSKREALASVTHNHPIERRIKKVRATEMTDSTGAP